MRVSGASSSSHWRSCALRQRRLGQQAWAVDRGALRRQRRVRQVGRQLEIGRDFDHQFGVRVLPARAHDLAFQVERPILVETAPAMVRPGERQGATEARRRRGRGCDVSSERLLLVSTRSSGRRRRRPARSQWTTTSVPAPAGRVCAASARAWNQAALQPATSSNPILMRKARLASSSAGWVANISEPLAAASAKPQSAIDSDSLASGCTGRAAARPNTRSSSATRLPSNSAMPTMCTTSSAG